MAHTRGQLWQWAESGLLAEIVSRWTDAEKVARAGELARLAENMAESVKDHPNNKPSESSGYIRYMSITRRR